MSGIQDVITQFEDGQVVEVDGDAGVIRFIDDVDVPSPERPVEQGVESSLSS